MLTKRLLYYGGVLAIASSLSACSGFEYIAQKKLYKITTSPMTTTAPQMDPIMEKENARSPAFYNKNRVSLLSVSKNKSIDKDLGSIHLKGLSSDPKKDLVFELSYNRKGYKASTPLFYSGDNMRGGLAFMVTRNRRLYAGFEFSIKFGK